MAAKDVILELRDVRAGYGDIEIIKGVSLEVRQGEILTIIGANGAGKSTLLKAIFGLVKPYSGQILFNGADISQMKPIQILKRGLSYAPAGRSNFPAMSVQENLEMGAFIRHDKAQIARQIDELCERFTILKEKRTTPVGNLSGGQQQMVELAIAMMLQPTLMLIDEPTIGLSPAMVNEVFQVVQEVNNGGTTLVLVEQNAKRALEIADYGLVLELGMIRYRGRADELAEFEDVYRAYLGEH